MELDKLKNILKEQNDKISENELLNKKLLKTILSGNSKKEINKLTGMVIANIFISILVVIVFFSHLISGHMGSLALNILTIVSIIFFLFYIVLGLLEYKLASQMNFANSTMLDLQRLIIKLKRIILFDRKLAFFMAPVLIACVLPVVNKIVHGGNMLEYPMDFMIRAIVGSAISYPLIIWIYKKFYTKPIKEIEYYMKEIESME